MATLPNMFVGTNVKALEDIGVPLTLIHDFAYGGVWTYRTPSGVVFTTDLDGVILPDATDNDDEVSQHAAIVEHNL